MLASGDEEKPSPFIVNNVPPANEPARGDKDVTVGSRVNVWDVTDLIHAYPWLCTRTVTS